jgi:hypothetical protein
MGIGGAMGIGGVKGVGGGDVGIPGTGGSGFGGSGTGGGLAFCAADAGAPHPGPGASILSFAAPIDYPNGANFGSRSVVFCDLNGDGRLDLVAGGSYDDFSTRMNLGAGAFGAAVHYGGAGAARSFACGDLDGDGHADVALANGRVMVFRNDGHGGLGAPVTYSVGSGSVAIALGDLNGDGRIDLAVANDGSGSDANADLGILLNVDNRTFSGDTVPAGSAPSAVAIGDFNQDCRPDIVVGANGTFNGFDLSGAMPRRFYSTGVTIAGVEVGDLDGDGRPDLLLAEAGGPYVDVALTLAAGIFGAAVQYPVNGVTSASADAGPIGGNTTAVLADFDGDGDLDMAAAIPCCGIGIKLNDGHGVFGPTHAVPRPGAASWPNLYSIVAGDFDGDGKIDLAVADAGEGRISILLNSSH